MSFVVMSIVSVVSVVSSGIFVVDVVVSANRAF